MAFAAEVIEPFRAATPPADPNGPATPLAEAMSRYIHGTLIIQAAVAVLTLYSIYYWYKVHEKYQAAKAGDASYKPAGRIGTPLNSMQSELVQRVEKFVVVVHTLR